MEIPTEGLVTLGLLGSMGMNEPPNIVSLVIHRFFDQSLLHWENIILSVLIGGVLALLFILGTRKPKLIPGRLQNFLELAVESFRNGVLSILGPDGERHIPFLGTLFFYILFMNIAGLFPLMKAPSSSINVTVGLALCVFVYVQYFNIKHMGFLGFLYHLAGAPKGALSWGMSLIMFPLELLTQLTRPVTLSMRLFGNVMGEEVLIATFAVMGIGAIAWLNLPIGLPIQLPFMLFGLFTGFLQAFIFTLLSTIYILLSTPGDGSHH